MLHHDPLEQLLGHPRVPDPFGIDDDDRTAGADAQARRLAALDASRAEEEVLALEQRGEQGVERAPTPVRRAEAASADEHVARIGLHDRRHARRGRTGERRATSREAPDAPAPLATVRLARYTRP